LVQGNLIGTDFTGTGSLGNLYNGIVIYGSSNVIGGTIAGAGNVIANTTYGDGVFVGSFETQNTILSNSIFNNGGLGINLSFGANNNQSPPMLSSAVYSSGSTTIDGSLTGQQPDTNYTLQFFANAVADPSGAGEGQTLIGTQTGTTDGSGGATFSFSFATTDTTGLFVSATASDSLGNTSAFAQNVTVASGAAAASLSNRLSSQQAQTATDSLMRKPPQPASRPSSPLSLSSDIPVASREDLIESLAMELIRSRRRPTPNGSR
jgi:titin